MEIKPIKNEKDYERALGEIEALFDAKGTEDADRLEVLTLLVQAYEEKHHPVGPPDPVEAIKFRMEQEGLTRKDLETYIGSKSKVSEVLSGARPLSLTMVRRLHEGLGIPAEVLIRSPHTAAKRRARKAPPRATRRHGHTKKAAKR